MERDVNGTWKSLFSYKNGKQTSLGKYLKGEHVTKKLRVKTR
jgi:hypothetical protein